MTNILKSRLLLTMVSVVALTACGGGNNDVATPTPPPGPVLVMGTDLPVTVEQSVTGLITFAKTQLTETSESSDPLIVGEAKLAIDDAAEPSDV